MNSNLLQPCIIELTRIAVKTSPKLKSGTLVKKISKHLPNFIDIKNKQINKKTKN